MEYVTKRPRSWGLSVRGMTKPSAPHAKTIKMHVPSVLSSLSNTDTEVGMDIFYMPHERIRDGDWRELGRLKRLPCCHGS